MSTLFYYPFAMKLSRFHNRIATNAHPKYVLPYGISTKLEKSLLINKVIVYFLMINI